MTQKPPAWVPCDCGNHWCRVHEAHAHDCPCPPVAVWHLHGLDPYVDSEPPPGTPPP